MSGLCTVTDHSPKAAGWNSIVLWPTIRPASPAMRPLWTISQTSTSASAHDYGEPRTNDEGSRQRAGCRSLVLGQGATAGKWPKEGVNPIAWGLGLLIS